MPPERSIATILFTDIVGSTERATELGDRGWGDLLEQHNELVRRELRRFHGKEISTAGDSFLAVFDGPALAILCACAIRDGMREVGLAVRCGLHMGEVEYTEGDVGGVAVHIGARVAARAGADEVLVSSTVRDAERGSGWGFDDLGTHELKGISGEWHLFRVTAVPDDAGGLLPSRRQRFARSARHRAGLVAVVVVALFSLTGLYALLGNRGEKFTTDVAPPEAAPGIAVLPFTVRGEGLDVWREGMMDLLSTGLDGAPGLRTISSRTLMARWDERVSETTTPDLATTLQVATATGARYALLGSAVGIGPDVRLVADIYDATSGNRLGRGQAEGSPDSLLVLVDRLATEVLRVVLQKGEAEIPRIDLASLMTESPEALRAYLEGLELWRLEQNVQAAEALEHAIAADSTFALAHYMLAEVYWSAPLFRPELRTRHLEQAVRLEERLTLRGRVTVRGALALNRGTADEVGALREWVRAHPDDARVWELLGETYFHVPGTLANADEIEESFARAAELDPKNPDYKTHLTELTLGHHADEKGSARLASEFVELIPGAVHSQGAAVAMKLAFGDSASHARTMAALDTMDLDVADRTSDFLLHPRYAPVLIAIAETARRNGDKAVLEVAGGFLFVIHALWRGELQQALEYLEEQPRSSRDLAEASYFARVVGLPVPDEILDRLLAASDIDDPVDSRTVFTMGAYSVDRDRWDDHAVAVAELERRADLVMQEADSVGARRAASFADGLKGYAEFRRGRPEAALPLLKSAQPETRIVRWWLGELYTELGRERDARRIFEAYAFWSQASAAASSFSTLVPFVSMPLAQKKLGKIYEQLEEYDKAIESYEYFVEYWQDADSELQPMVEEARQAIIRLKGLRRE
jgi:tetratricopeptide (TPR) repeat protein